MKTPFSPALRRSTLRTAQRGSTSAAAAGSVALASVALVAVGTLLSEWADLAMVLLGDLVLTLFDVEVWYQAFGLAIGL